MATETKDPYAWARKHTVYEWVIETMEDGEIVDVDHADIPPWPIPDGCDLALIRDHYDDGKNEEREYAYVGRDGSMPGWTDGCDGRTPHGSIPVKYRKQLERAIRRAGGV